MRPSGHGDRHDQGDRRAKGFVATYPGAGACPYTGGTETLCPNPAFSFATNGTYTLSLAVGKWTIAGFYESNGLNGAFLGTPEVVTVAKGKTITKDLTVAYQKPAAIKGSIRITGVPTGISIDELSVLLCPSYAPYNGTSASLTCVNGYGNQQGNSSPYAVTGLPPGTWIAYPGFCSEIWMLHQRQSRKDGDPRSRGTPPPSI